MDSKKYSNHIDLKNISISDPFWSRMIDLVRTEVIPYQYEALNDRIPGAEKSYCIENFVKASRIIDDIRAGKTVPTYPADKWHYDDKNADDNAFHGWVFQDSDVYKWIEAASYSLVSYPDAELEKRVDECIDLICSAQLDNGYLDTLYVINNRDECFSNLKDFHELYCFGHLAEAAVAYYLSTGKDKLLNATCRFADLICDTFGEDKIKGYPGHEIAELALVKLYDITGKQAYLDMAKFFVDERGKKPYYYDLVLGKKTVDDNYHYNQAHRPPRMQREAVGHAVRGVYLYSGMADVARRFDDDELYSACQSIWDNIENRKMYITGGVGATVDGEAFSFNYDLPNDLAYSETCASIGLCFFARRMLEISPNSHYADVMERALYNTILSGMAEDGKSFFYVNPLEVLPEASHKDSRKWHIKPVRQKWFGCACCPPNLARIISSIGEYCYTENEDTVFVHQYIGSSANTKFGCINIQSSYIDNGQVTIKIDAEKPFTLAVRIPSWCKEFSISEEYTVSNDYAYIKVDGNKNIDIKFDIQPRFVKCSNRVRANVGKVALMRGPIVYCLEGVDNGDNLQMLRVDTNTDFRFDGDKIITKGYRSTVDDELYADYSPNNEQDCDLIFTPYYRWGNRGENEMSVYVRI